MRQKAFRSFPNRYPFSLYYEVISSFSIRYNLEIILAGHSTCFIMHLQFNAEGVVRLIAQGWRQPTLGYACSVEVNAVGVVRFLSGIPR